MPTVVERSAVVSGDPPLTCRLPTVVANGWQREESPPNKRQSSFGDIAARERSEEEAEGSGY
jgi:hypothetical protein